MKKTEIKTKRMLLRPMTDEEIETLTECADSEEPRAAYAEMLDGCRRDPENRIWYAPWEMTLKDSRERVGEIGFLAGTALNAKNDREALRRQRKPRERSDKYRLHIRNVQYAAPVPITLGNRGGVLYLCAPLVRDKAVAYIALALPALFIDPLPIGGRIEVFKITVGLRGEVYLRNVHRVEIRHELSVDRRAADNEAALIFCRQRQRLLGAVRDLCADNFDILPGDDDVVPPLERSAAGEIAKSFPTDDDGCAVRQLSEVGAVGLEHDGLSPAAADAPV